MESLWNQDGTFELVVLQSINNLHRTAVQDKHAAMKGDDVDMVLALVIENVAFHNFHCHSPS